MFHEVKSTEVWRLTGSVVSVVPARESMQYFNLLVELQEKKVRNRTAAGEEDGENG